MNSWLDFGISLLGLSPIITNHIFFLLDIRILRKALASACASCLCLYFTAPWCLLWELKVHRPYRGRKGIGTSWKYHETELLWNLVETSSPSGGFLQWWYPTTMGFPTKKMTILRCFGGTTIYGNTQIVMKIGGDFITICVLWSFSSHAVSKLIASPVEMAGGECLARDHVP